MSNEWLAALGECYAKNPDESAENSKLPTGLLGMPRNHPRTLGNVETAATNAVNS